MKLSAGMLVLSRHVGESISIWHSDSDHWVITIEAIRGESFRLSAAHRDPMVGKIISVMKRDDLIDIGPTVKISAVDIRGDKVGLGIYAPKTSSVHRTEVFDAIRRENDAAKRIHRNQGGDDPDGLAGSRVPRPGSPRPPELKVRLEEPRPEGDG